MGNLKRLKKLMDLRDKIKAESCGIKNPYGGCDWCGVWSPEWSIEGVAAEVCGEDIDGSSDSRYTQAVEDREFICQDCNVRALELQSLLELIKKSIIRWRHRRQWLKRR